jgi:LysM repeat protein
LTDVNKNEQMKKLILSTIIFFVTANLFAQKMTPEEYVSTYKDAAIQEMKRSGVPASITLSQGILETESGNSRLVKMSNNHFGIKCRSNWTGESVRYTDDAANECFRKYPSAAESYKDHSEFLKNSERYASLFLLAKNDYKGWAYGLKKAGYATNPQYPQLLISNIEKYGLQNYDVPQQENTATIDEQKVEEKKVEVQETITDAVTQINDALKAVSYENDALALAIKSKSKFNGLKAIFASKGTSLLAIATEADITLTKLLEINDMKEDGLLKEDQIVYLEKKNKLGKKDTYTAVQNEKLYDIAQNNAIQLKTLVVLNNLSEYDIIEKGKTISLR